jgi:Dyp-type peroxidase family
MLPDGTEHFGFKDGIAQPYVDDPARPANQPRAGYAPPSRGLATAVRAEGAEWPDWEAIRQEAAGADPKRVERVHVPFRSPGVPTLPAQQFLVAPNGTGDDLTAHGSFMVWLQLQQIPSRFWAVCEQLAAGLNKTWGSDIAAEVAAAMLLGRARDGTPLEPSSPTSPEDFSYYGDPSARRCPAGAHVRLVNPRDVQSLRRMILRRGIPYGEPAADRTYDDGQDRGLLFVCYQQSIEQQYEVLQRELANARYEDGQPGSQFPDALISQASRDGTTIEIAEPYGRGAFGMRRNNTWIVPRGGLYLFVPSMHGLDLLAG